VLPQKRQPATPVARPSLMMRDRDDDDFARVNCVNQVVPERPKPELANVLVHRVARQRMFNHEVDGREEVLLKTIPKTGPLLVKVGCGFMRLGFGRLEEPSRDHFFRARRRANTSSAGTASMVPALYSA